MWVRKVCLREKRGDRYSDRQTDGVCVYVGEVVLLGVGEENVRGMCIWESLEEGQES